MTSRTNWALALSLAAIVVLAYGFVASAQTRGDQPPTASDPDRAAQQARLVAAEGHEAFRRQHQVRSPHPQWFNSLRPGALGGQVLTLAQDYRAR